MTTRKRKRMKRFAFDKAGPYWLVTFVYSIEKYGWGSLDAKIRKLIGQCDGGGTGLGERDQDWAFADEASAKRAMKLLQPLVDGVNTYSYCDQREYVPNSERLKRH